jgi:hypothetical protein
MQSVTKRAYLQYEGVKCSRWLEIFELGYGDRKISLEFETKRPELLFTGRLLTLHRLAKGASTLSFYQRYYFDFYAQRCLAVLYSLLWLAIKYDFGSISEAIKQQMSLENAFDSIASEGTRDVMKYVRSPINLGC